MAVVEVLIRWSIVHVVLRRQSVLLQSIHAVSLKVVLHLPVDLKLDIACHSWIQELVCLLIPDQGSLLDLDLSTALIGPGLLDRSIWIDSFGVHLVDEVQVGLLHLALHSVVFNWHKVLHQDVLVDLEGLEVLLVEVGDVEEEVEQLLLADLVRCCKVAANVVLVQLLEESFEQGDVASMQLLEHRDDDVHLLLVDFQVTLSITASASWWLVAQQADLTDDIEWSHKVLDLLVVRLCQIRGESGQRRQLCISLLESEIFGLIDLILVQWHSVHIGRLRSRRLHDLACILLSWFSAKLMSSAWLTSPVLPLQHQELPFSEVALSGLETAHSLFVDLSLPVEVGDVVSIDIVIENVST